MVEKYLGEKQAENLFYASMISGMLDEGQTAEVLDSMEKKAQRGGGGPGFWGRLGLGALGLIPRGARVGFSGLTRVPSALGWTSALGAGLGAVGALGYDAVKEHLTREDPEAKFNEDVEALYKGKDKEEKDSRWMAKVRSMRDDLKRNWKKMTTAEYSSKYQALMDALDERKA